MSSPKSPYREMNISPIAFQKRKKQKTHRELYGRGDKKIGPGHLFEVGRFGVRFDKRPDHKATCRYCHQPKFAVEFAACTAKRR